MPFKDDFMWGVASSALQIEGAWNSDGKGLSVWDIASKRKNFVEDGGTIEVACNSYNNIERDVGYLKKLGVKAYRFSLSWPRIIPDGNGAINPKGLNYYRELAGLLKENNIEPLVTLFHWDYPHELFKQGGWLSPQSVKWFANYAKIVSQNLSDLVRYFFTINEPECFVGLGHETAIHAPGITLAKKELLQITHNVLMAHGAAVKALRDNARQPIKIGYAPVGKVKYPASETPENINAARKATFDMNMEDPAIENNVWHNLLWMDPVFKGEYPKKVFDYYGNDFPIYSDNDLKIISQPIDFCGLNMYHGRKVKYADNKRGYAYVPFEIGHSQTHYGWPITPEILYWGPRFFYERYQKPIIITENGISSMDWIHSDGKVHDPQRIDYINRYCSQMKRAVKDGIKIIGYTHWTLYDNFEFNHGYTHRFGLLYYDFTKQEVVEKDSFDFYKKVIKSNGECLT